MLRLPTRYNAIEILSDSLRKFSIFHQSKNPVMFCVYMTCWLCVWLCIEAAVAKQPNVNQLRFTIYITGWLWLTVWFANLAEAIAEGRGRAQASSLRRARATVMARRAGTGNELIPATELAMNDVIEVMAGEVIPADGEVVAGIASVDESAITGESAPVVRESGGDRSAVTGGTRVISDWLRIRVTSLPGQSFLDRMIAMVEGAKRQKTPNEIALGILLTCLTLIFLIVVASLYAMSAFSAAQSGRGTGIEVVVLAALFVCLAPTTIGALLSAIGIAGMNRLGQANVVAMSGRAVEAAGDIDVLLLDKTGTITLGNRQATTFIPAPGVTERTLAEACQWASFADETAEGRSIVVLCKSRFDLRGLDFANRSSNFVPFSAKTRMSGVDLDGIMIRKGAVPAVEAHVKQLGGQVPSELRTLVQQISQAGSTPLLVSQQEKVLGIIELKDIVKGGIKERFIELRQMGIRTVMITGDNPLTAAAIAAEAGVDDYLAEATPENKLDLIRSYQKGGRLVAMTGDGTNDAPALAQADVAVAMNSGTQAAKEAGNMVDLDSNPTKLIEIVRVGKQLLMTRGALTTFSIANDVAKYFAIIPAACLTIYPELDALNLMRLSSPQNAILAAVIFNALVILLLVPLALRGVQYRPTHAAGLLRRNLLIYGIGGIAVPFVGIKLIDWSLVFMGGA